MIKRNIKIVITILAFLMIILFIAYMFSPGSYNNVIRFKVEVSEKEAILRIDSLKKSNKSIEYLTAHNYVDGRRGVDDHWYHFYVYYPNSGEILKCWLRGEHGGGATIALVSIKIDDRWRILDKDFSGNEKKTIKKKFEDEFINLIK